MRQAAGTAAAMALGALALAACAQRTAVASGADGGAAGGAGFARAHWGTIARQVRITGTIVPAHSAVLVVPQLHESQQFGQLTLSYLAPSGVRVQKGQEVAAFDRTQLEDAAADARAQCRSLEAQVREQKAKNAAAAAQRAVAMRKAMAAEGHARLELEKKPVLTGLEIAADQVKMADAAAHVQSLRQAGAWLAKEAAAKLQALRLERDEQQQVWRRTEQDSQKMILRAPLAGMVASAVPAFYGRVAPGTRLYSGIPLVRIFDPSQMLVAAKISEVDLAWVPPHAQAWVLVDAYPELRLPAHLVRLNPIAVSPLGTPLHQFRATFAMDRNDPRALPDLNASVIVSSGPRTGWLVPRDEVHYQNGAAFVWEPGPGSGRRRRAIRVAAFAGPWIEIQAPWLAARGRRRRARP